VREALEFQQLYHTEKGTPQAARAARQAEVLADIETTGTYTHTYDELQHGARVAWRCAALPI
jgi:nitric-oxide synthase